MPPFSVWRPLTLVRFTDRSQVSLVLRMPGYGIVGGALLTRLPHANVGTFEIRVPSQIGGWTSFNAWYW